MFHRNPEVSAVLKRHRRNGDGLATTASNPSGWLGRGTGPTQQHRPSGKSEINMTGLTEVEIEKLKGNAGNSSNLDSKGFPKRFSHSRGTLSPTHHPLHKATDLKSLTIHLNINHDGKVLGKSDTHASVKEHGGKGDKKPNTDENKPELGDDNQTSGWKVLHTEIGIGTACGALLVFFVIIVLYWRRMKKRGKIEVAVLHANIPTDRCSTKKAEKSNQV